MRTSRSERATLSAARAALDKHANDVVILDLRKLSSVFEFFVIATAESTRQAEAIVEHVEQQLDHIGHRVRHVEGRSLPSTRGSRRIAEAPGTPGERLSWVLMDCGDLVIHLFTPPARALYQLERLWGDAPRIPLPSA